MESIARTGRGGWQENEITQLREAVRRAGGNGEPLRGVFEQIGASLGLPGEWPEHSAPGP